MKRVNSFDDVASSGTAILDAGDGVQLEVPVAPADTRDTGTLTVTSNFPEVTNGSIWVRRVGATVHVTLYDLEFANSTPPEFFYLAGALPPGYRPAANTSFAALADVSGTTTRRVRFQANGQILLYGISSQSRINVTASYLTPDSWPTA